MPGRDGNPAVCRRRWRLGSTRAARRAQSFCRFRPCRRCSIGGVIFAGALARHVALGNVAGERGAVAPARVAIAAAARASAAGSVRRPSSRSGPRPAPRTRPPCRAAPRSGCAPPGLPPARPCGGNRVLSKRRTTVASSSSSYSRRMLRPPRQCPAPPESGTRSKRVIRQGYSDSRISIGVMCRLLRCVAVADGAVMAHAAAIGRADDLVLHGRLARPALSPGDAERARRARIGDGARRIEVAPAPRGSRRPA